MTRDEMLDKLKKIDFEYLWTGSNLEDLIGFTEQPIWLNKMGYGYFSCDEANQIEAVESVPSDKWLLIREKIANGSISYSDIRGTSLEHIFEFEDTFVEEDYKKLLELPEQMGNFIYCYSTFEGLEFFDNENSALEFFRRDYCEVEWDSLCDEELKSWISCLEDEDFEYDSPFEYK